MSAHRGGAQRGRGGPGSGAGNSYPPRDYANKSSEEITRELNEIMFNYNPKGTRREVRVNGQEFPPWVYNPDTVPDKTTVDFMFHPDVFKTKDCEKGSKCTLRACAFVHPGEKYIPRWRATGAVFDGQFVPPIPITYEWFRYLMLEFKIQGPCQETIPHDYGRCAMWHIDRKTGDPLDRRTPLRWIEAREDWSPPVGGSQTAMSYHPLRYKCQPCNKIAARQVCPRGRYCVHDHLNGDFRTIEKYLDRLKRESLAEDQAKKPRSDPGPSLPVGMVAPQPAQKSPQKSFSAAAAALKPAPASEIAPAGGANVAREISHQGPPQTQPSPAKTQQSEAQKPATSSENAHGQGAPKPSPAPPSQSTPARVPSVPQPKPPAPIVPGLGSAAPKKPEQGSAAQPPQPPKSGETTASKFAAGGGGGGGSPVPQPRPPQPPIPGTPLKTAAQSQDGKSPQTKQSGGLLPNKQQISAATTPLKPQQPPVPRPEPPKPPNPPLTNTTTASRGSGNQPTTFGPSGDKVAGQVAATGPPRSTNGGAATSTPAPQSPAVFSADGISPQKTAAPFSGGVQTSTAEIATPQPRPAAVPAASSGNGVATGREFQPAAKTPTPTGAAVPTAGGIMSGSSGFPHAGLHPNNATAFASVFSNPTTPFSSVGDLGGTPVTGNSAPATPAISTTPTGNVAPPGFGYLPGEAGMAGNTLAVQQQASFPGPAQIWGGQGGVQDMSRRMGGPGASDGGAQMYWQAVLQQQQVAQGLILAQYLALQQQAVRNLQAAGLGGSLQMGTGVQGDPAAGEQAGAGVGANGALSWQTMENQQIGATTPTPSTFPEPMGLYGGAFSPSMTPATLPPGLMGGVPYGAALGARNLGFPVASPAADMQNLQMPGVSSSNPAVSATLNGPFGQYFAQGPPPPGFSLPSSNGLGAGFSSTPPISGGAGGGSVGGASPARVVAGGLSDSGEGSGESDLATKELREWTKDDVHRWASNHSATQVRETADRLRSHDIDGELLRNLDDPGLKELGIVSFGQRKKLLTAVREEFGHDAAANILPILDDSPSPHTKGMGFSFYSN